jgi:hypothetical protein
MIPKICEIDMLRKSVARLEERSCRVDDMVDNQMYYCRLSTYDEDSQVYVWSVTSRTGHCRSGDGVASLNRGPKPRTATQKPTEVAARQHPIGSCYVAGTPVWKYSAAKRLEKRGTGRSCGQKPTGKGFVGVLACTGTRWR